MPYTTIAALRTARNNALKDSDWWMQPDVLNSTIKPVHESLNLSRTSYREELRNIPGSVKLDSSNNPVLNADGNLQDTNDAVIELPTVPE